MRDKTDARGGERGQLMAGLMVMIAIMLIFSTVVFQSWEDLLRRDHEAEMMFRAQEIVHAIVRFRKERGVAPAKLEELLEPGSRGQYFLRQGYLDPLVRDGRWGLLYGGPGGEVIDPNGLFVGDEDTLAKFGSAALSGNTAGLDKDERAELARRRQAGRERARIDPRRRMTESSLLGTDPVEESRMAGGRQMPGLQIAGVKSLSLDRPFRFYQGHNSYSKWLFTYVDLERARAKAQGKTKKKKNRGGRRGRNR